MTNAIGTEAGIIWELLSQKGSQTLAQIKKETPGNDFTTSAAIGWLAREGNVEVTPSGKSVKVSLTLQ